MKTKVLIDALREMRTQLPHGAIEEVRKKRKVSRTLIERIFDDTTSISEKGYLVISDFKAIIEKEKQEAAKQAAEINRVLSK